MEQIIEYLQDLGVSSRQHLETPGSPQFQATSLWLAQENGLTMEIPTATTNTNTNTNTPTTNSDNSDDAITTSTHTRFVERYVLAVFYYATNGPMWHHQLNFLSARDICERQKPVITSSGTPLTMGVSNCVTVDVEVPSLGEVINRMMQQRTSEHCVDVVLFVCCSIECANLQFGLFFFLLK
jgi:hypothetical protein